MNLHWDTVLLRQKGSKGVQRHSQPPDIAAKLQGVLGSTGICEILNSAKKSIGYGGGKGIRTPGTWVSTPYGFTDRCLQPLGHPSAEEGWP